MRFVVKYSTAIVLPFQFRAFLLFLLYMLHAFKKHLYQLADYIKSLPTTDVNLRNVRIFYITDIMYYGTDSFKTVNQKKLH